MNKEEYYEKSKEQGLPLRCPILNNCQRRAESIFYVSYFVLQKGRQDILTVLNEHGIIKEDFPLKMIKIQGEPPIIIKGTNNALYSNMCPEVSLFDSAHNILGTNLAWTTASWDKYRQNQVNVHEEKHFSECAEFNHNKYTQKKINPNKKKRISVSPKDRSKLQQEIYSTCPFCDNTDVGHFEIHHIDENPANNDFRNLLMVCRICHSKITKNEISKTDVEIKKHSLKFLNKIELIGVTVDEKNCAWEKKQGDFSFYRNNSTKSPHPILEFGFINHFDKTLVLKTITVRAQRLYSGLSGIPMACKVPLVGRYKIFISDDDAIHTVEEFDQIQVPKEQAFNVQLELACKYNEEIEEIRYEKWRLFFSFELTNGVSYACPDIFLNCQDENEKMKLFVLH